MQISTFYHALVCTCRRGFTGGTRRSGGVAGMLIKLERAIRRSGGVPVLNKKPFTCGQNLPVPTMHILPTNTHCGNGNCGRICIAYVLKPVQISLLEQQMVAST